MSRFKKNSLKNSVSGSLFLSLIFAFGASQPAMALPQNGTVVGGSATITTGATTVDINQSTNRAIINWSSFDIAANEAVKFAQPSSSSVTLNRVTASQNASQILGSLSANGTVILINPQGVAFGAGSQVNVGGLVASSSDIDNDRFMNGDFTFDKAGNPNATISNAGTIKIADGGLAAFVGPNVTNTGLIQAKLGKVQLASGDVFTLDLYGDGLISLQASDAIVKQLVSNSGSIVADGGTILLTTGAALNSLSSVINMDGLLQADSVATKNGHVVLFADGGETNVAGTISAKGKNAGETGGKVEVLGKTVTVKSGAVIDASGQAGGGTILVGGDFKGAAGTATSTTTEVEEGASLIADAIDNGQGGNIAVWSDGATYFQGAISAKGGANGGNGGYVETSGETLNVTGAVDASAANGEAGTWLLDPANIRIFATCSKFDSSCVKASSIVSAINGTGVTVYTSGDIEVGADLQKTSSTAASLTLVAGNDITFDYGYKLYSTGGLLNISLQAGGQLVLNDNYIATKGGNVTITGKGVTIDQSTIDASGTTVGGTVSITGTGSSTNYLHMGDVGHYGVLITNTYIKTNNSGSVSITGTGGNSSYAVSSVDNYGVDLENSLISTEAGAITLNGTGGSSTGHVASVNNYGVAVDGSSLSTTAGTISVTGKGGSNSYDMISANNYGVGILNGSGIKTVSGDITLQGTAGTNSHVWIDSNSVGIYSDSGNNCFSQGQTNYIGSSFDLNHKWNTGTTEAGNITLIADSMNVGNDLAIQTSGIVTIKPLTASTSIGVAGADGALQVTSALLHNIQASTIVIGDKADTKLLKVNGFNWSSDVQLLNGTGDIEIAGSELLGNHTFVAYSKSGDIIIDKKGSVFSKASGTAITLAGAHLHNYNFAKEYSALTVGESGRWLVYLSEVAGNDFGNLNSNNTAVWGKTYNAAVSQTGNRYVFAESPTVTLTVTSLEKTYGTDLTATLASDYTLSGLVSGVNGVFKGDTLSVSLTSAGASALADVGTYTISLSSSTASALQALADAGYKVKIVNGKPVIVVDQALLTVSANNQSMTYGGTLPTLTYSVDGLVNGQTADSILTGLLATVAANSNAGTYGITRGTLTLTSGNYKITTFVDGTLTINKASLIVRANNQTISYGDPLPTYYTYQVNGLVNGDTISNVFSGALASSLTSQTIGGFPITKGSLKSNGNYNITTFVDGTLTVNAPGFLNSNNEQGIFRALASKGLGYNGILLALAQQNGNGLNRLAPAAGGNGPVDFAEMTAADLSNLAPAAGGANGGYAGILPLIECNDETPCALNQ